MDVDKATMYLVRDWNNTYPAGTPVTYTDDAGQSVYTKTRSEAWRLGDGTAVILLEGRTGSVAFERVAACANGEALGRYRTLVDELLLKRANGPLSDDEEERYATMLNDCRAGMTELEQAQIGKDLAYKERDMCVALVACLARAQGYRVGIRRHEGGTWDDDWRNVVMIDLPTGQVSWHVHDSEMAWFAWLPAYPDEWDGHHTDEKYQRVLRCALTLLTAASSAPTAGEFALLRSKSVPRCEAVFFPVKSWSVTDWACALAGEVGEVCDAAKKLKRGDGTVQDIADELADVLTYADLLAASLDIDLWQALCHKFNVVSERYQSPIRLPESKAMNDAVNHPSHYNMGKIEVIEAIEDWQLGFHLGNAVKYIARAGKKEPDKLLDLKKARWYLNRAINDDVIDCEYDEVQEDEDTAEPVRLRALYLEQQLTRTEQRLVQLINERNQLREQVTDLQTRMTAMVEERRAAEQARIPTCKTCGTKGRHHGPYSGAYFCVTCCKWLEHQCGGACQFCKDQPAVPVSRLL